MVALNSPDGPVTPHGPPDRVLLTTGEIAMVPRLGPSRTESVVSSRSVGQTSLSLQHAFQVCGPGFATVQEGPSPRLLVQRGVRRTPPDVDE